MRKLVTIRKISKLVDIPKKDLIALAVIDGWSVIVKKSEFSVNDYCVFFEIDSFLPATDVFSFLGKSTSFKGNQGYRLKTMKMAGCLSQGLALPTSMFGIHNPSEYYHQDYDKLTDLSDKLGVVKWEIEENTPMPQKTSTNPRKFPSFIPKTDEPRIQNLSHYFDAYKNLEFEETLKLDGSSMTIYKVHKTPSIWSKILSFITRTSTKDYEFGVCSRNVNLNKNDNNVIQFDNNGIPSEYNQSNFWVMANKLNLQDVIPSGYAIQGELIGPKIQNNHEKVTALEFYCFSIYDINNQKYLLPSDRVKFCKKYKIPHVPIVNPSIKIFTEHTSLDSLLKHVEGPSMNPNTISEGRVFKQVDGPIHFKVISNKYLLKTGK